MRGLILCSVLASLVCIAADAAPRRKKPRKRTAPATKPEPKKKAETPPAVAEAAAQPSPAGEDGWRVQTTLSLGAGGFYGGGANLGPALSSAVTLTPARFGGRFALDVDLTWRVAVLKTQVEGYGTLTSALHGFPVIPALRFRALQVGKLTLDLRAGVGPQLLLHALSSDFAEGAVRTAVGWEAFAAVQARFPAGPVQLFAELRGGLGEAHIPFVLGKAQGAQAQLGARYPLP